MFECRWLTNWKGIQSWSVGRLPQNLPEETGKHIPNFWSFCGSRIQWNFLGQTATSGCDVFPTFREQDDYVLGLDCERNSKNSTACRKLQQVGWLHVKPYMTDGNQFIETLSTTTNRQPMPSAVTFWLLPLTRGVVFHLATGRTEIYEGCLESIQPYWISRELVAWPWCNLAASQRRPYCTTVNSHSPVGLVSRQWDTIDWACVLCDRRIPKSPPFQRRF